MKLVYEAVFIAVLMLLIATLSFFQKNLSSSVYENNKPQTLGARDSKPQTLQECLRLLEN